MEHNRPRSRERNVTGSAKPMGRKGSGLGTGPVGSADGYKSKNGSAPSGSGKSVGGSSGAGSPGRGGFGTGTPGGGGFGTGSSGGGGFGTGTPGRGSYGTGPSGHHRKSGGLNPLVLIVVVIIIFLGGGKGLFSMFSGGSSGSSQQSQSAAHGTGHSAYGTGNSQNSSGHNGSSQTGQMSSSGTAVTPAAFSSGIGSSQGGTGGSASAQTTGTVSGAREKRTRILGNGKDTVTIMVYMCGTDLESRSGMATADLQEMASAKLGKVNLIVYTGGCLRWKNNIVSSKVNQIYQVKNGKMQCLVDNAGTGAMTDPSTLASFIKWCGNTYPANRNELIFWDHGGGSVSGFGYDEKNGRSSSMTLAGINSALKAGGVAFDFIGFDACLMATTENALMLNSYGDYMIGSEETEPGVGWYYTDWLTKLGSNTSMATTDIGRQIADDFVRVCAKRCPGQQTTLSVVDLAEFAATVPEKLTDFSKAISSMLSGKQYREVSSARNRTREFASSSRIDQIDLVDLCNNLGTTEGNELAKALRGAVKYNTYNNISRASGVSIYFPYKSTSKVDSAVNTYSAIGMDDSYSQCIKAFASMEAAGQYANGGTGSPLGSLLGGAYGSSSSSSYEGEALTALLEAFFGGDTSAVSSFGGSSFGFLSGRALKNEEVAEYIRENHFDESELVWEKGEDGTYRMSLSEGNWDMVDGLDLNMFYDDGEGFIDYGLDNIFSYDDEGRLVAATDKIWLGLGNVTVPYYHENTEDDGENYIISGRIPCLLNGTRAELIAVFDNDHPNGYLAGARTVYKNGETDTAAKTLTELSDGDKIVPIADYYRYDGTYIDTYELCDPLVYSDKLELGNLEFKNQGAMEVTYRFRDLYNCEHWTPSIRVE